MRELPEPAAAPASGCSRPHSRTTTGWRRLSSLQPPVTAKPLRPGAAGQLLSESADHLHNLAALAVPDRREIAAGIDLIHKQERWRRSPWKLRGFAYGAELAAPRPANYRASRCRGEAPHRVASTLAKVGSPVQESPGQRGCAVHVPPRKCVPGLLGEVACHALAPARGVIHRAGNPAAVHVCRFACCTDA